MQRLAGAALVLVALAASAEARPRRTGPVSPEVSARLAALEERATACFAETILSNAAALRAARSGRWYEAAGVVGFLCRPEAGAIMRAHDALAGRQGPGLRYFRGPYVRGLETALSARLAGELSRTAYATAEPPGATEGR